MANELGTMPGDRRVLEMPSGSVSFHINDVFAALGKRVMIIEQMDAERAQLVSIVNTLQAEVIELKNTRSVSASENDNTRKAETD